MGLLDGEDFAGGLVLADEADFGLVVADRHLEDAAPEVEAARRSLVIRDPDA